ncbi:hypothetical protein RIF23_11365 [Lipingzhangella sp. LS1_29]|uniref:MFS transporter n=1 Tax=Lipingzhangella rawalii TaxID=2055835 RepID=A0ABU2H7R6_9ACTN|nr:hypothetical protein [Lipingzhangella rawalii]MDS1270900.1 hypothetical protein [Lipingzhangella rawalii]
MSSPVRPVRTARSAMFAAVCCGVSGVGHGLATGTTIPGPGLLLGFVLLLGVGRAITCRERGYATILAWMLWGQLVLHLLFHQAQGSHGHAAPPAGEPAVAETAAPVAMDSPLAMLGLHIGAALLSAWWLRQGEAAVFTLARLVAAAATPLLLDLRRHRPVLPARVRIPLGTLDSPALHGAVLVDTQPSRGPPPR